MGCTKSSSKRENYSATSLPQEIRKISNNLNLHLKQLEKEKQTKSKVSRREEIMMTRTQLVYKSLSRFRLFVTPPLSMEIRQARILSAWPFPSRGDLPNSWTEP